MFKFISSLSALTLALGFFATVGVTGVLAQSFLTPAELLSSLTERPVEELRTERFDSGLSYGQMAQEAGLLEDFKAGVLDVKRASLADRVEQGLLSQEEADALLSDLEARREDCSGEPGQGLQPRTGRFGSQGQGLGAGGEKRGQGLGRGQGQGAGQGQGRGQGRGAGQGGQFGL